MIVGHFLDSVLIPQLCKCVFYIKMELSDIFSKMYMKDVSKVNMDESFSKMCKEKKCFLK